MDNLITIGSYAGAVITLVTLITLIVKPLRSKFVEWITKASNTEAITAKIDVITEKLDKSIE